MDEISTQSLKKKPGGLICRVEPNNIEWISQFPLTTRLMKNDGWFIFCERLQGYNLQATKAFIKNYKEGVVDFKDFKIVVNEQVVAEVTGIIAEGEQWFKQQDFEGDYGEFMLPGFESLNWSNGVHISKIKPNWKIPLEVIQNYITCDGRFDKVLRCHVRLLMHLQGRKKLNLPYYLWRSLQKMVLSVQKRPKHTDRSIFHQGLIKLLILHHLKQIGKDWDQFIREQGFETKEKKKSTKKKGQESKYSDGQAQCENFGKEQDTVQTLLNIDEDKPINSVNLEKMDLGPRTKARAKVAVEIILLKQPVGEHQIVSVNESDDEMIQEKDTLVTEGEGFIEVQIHVGQIPEIFVENKQRHIKNKASSSGIQKDNIVVDAEEIKRVPELDLVKRSLQSYKEQCRYLHSINESLMISNKRLREDLEQRDIDYEKLAVIAKDTLQKKKVMNEECKQMKAQLDQLKGRERNEDAEFSRLQRRSQVLNEMADLAESSRSI